MRCEVCGLPVYVVGRGPVTVQRMRPLHPAQLATVALSEAVPIERVTVCSEACAGFQQRRWQNQDLAHEILSAIGSANTSAERAVVSIISAHRARWEDS
jgi:hypothetical protein